jgi:pimeloyl-ACP methyl ester carboxylesterase
VKFLLSFLFPYLLCLLLVFLFQRKILYFPQTLTIDEQKQLASELQLKLWPTEDESYLGLISTKPLVDNKGTIVVFHGNAGSANGRIYFLDALEKLGYRVILAEYPGYGAKTETPSEKTLLEEATRTVQKAYDDFDGPLFLWGDSLGTGVVAGLARKPQVPVKAIALIAPYDSMANIAQYHYWFLLPKLLLLDRFNSAKNLQHFNGKIAVIMAGKDEVIPNSSTLNLYNSLQVPKKIWTFPEAGHNTLPLAPDNSWWREVMNFLD